MSSCDSRVQIVQLLCEPSGSSTVGVDTGGGGALEAEAPQTTLGIIVDLYLLPLRSLSN